MDLTNKQSELIQLCRNSEDYARLMLWRYKPEDVARLIEAGYLKQDEAGVVTTTEAGLTAYYAHYDKRKA